MDYEKLHKDTITKLQEMVNSGKITVEIAHGICADFIPESEDEKIRKDIISYLKSSTAISPKTWIAWLEKQGKKDEEILILKDQIESLHAAIKALKEVHKIELEKQGKNNTGISEDTKQKLEGNLNKALEKETPKSWNEFLEKQGEQKSVEWSIFDYRTWQYIVSDVLAKHDGIGQYLDDGTCKNIAKYMQEEWSKKLSTEQKPADKVEPKFKVGDYIISNNNSEIIYHITGTGINELGNPDYICKHVGREKEYNGRIYNMSQDKVDANFRLWNIRDAKKGDILEFVDHGRLVVGIVSFVNERTGKVDVSCLLEDNKFKIGNFYALDTINPHPATKEQRDLLFQKMKEAGYEWDAEKKELKEIEHSPAWSEEDEQHVDSLLERLDGLCRISL